MYCNLMDMTMGMKIAIVMAVVTFSWFELSSQVQLELEGGLTIGQSPDNNPEPGTIRWNGLNFEGWNGIFWVTLSGNVLDTISDINGNIYKTLKIGNDTWMIENLRTRNLNDGIFIPDIEADSNWFVSFPARCRYNDSDSNIQPFGYLYNNRAVEDDRLCPVGWLVSTYHDWEDLITHLGGESIAGGPLKQAGSEHWLAPNTGATNETGFTALPGGQRKPDGTYNNLGLYGNYWSYTDIGSPYIRNFQFNTVVVATLLLEQSGWGFSVRCVKD
ncbi:MAG: fibrobacter succinogenes major paralogous domain-containing protein [Saprospiraceae bacterium]|nr:fibrobacter succinogenes major paralogous domain-containing protein [Saprospiraceae bacterium]